jgi:hypothetical protein
MGYALSDKAVLQAQLKALRLWGSKEPSDLSKIQQPVLVANSDSDRMVPTKTRTTWRGGCRIAS